MTGSAPPLLTLHQVAARWSCSTRFVQIKVQRGELRALRLGPKLTRVALEDVEAYEASLKTYIEPADLEAAKAGDQKAHTRFKEAANTLRLQAKLQRRS